MTPLEEQKQFVAEKDSRIVEIWTTSVYIPGSGKTMCPMSMTNFEIEKQNANNNSYDPTKV